MIKLFLQRILPRLEINISYSQASLGFRRRSTSNGFNSSVRRKMGISYVSYPGKPIVSLLTPEVQTGLPILLAKEHPIQATGIRQGMTGHGLVISVAHID